MLTQQITMAVDDTNLGDRTPRLDRSTRAQIMIGEVHHEIHDGNLWFLKDVLFVSGGANVSDYMIFTTPDTDEEIHARALFNNSSVEFECTIFRNATIIDTPKVQVPFSSANHIIDKESPLIAYAADDIDTGDDIGTQFWRGKIGEGKGGGIDLAMGYEIVAGRNETYVFEIKKIASTNPGWIDVDFFYYSHIRKT